MADIAPFPYRLTRIGIVMRPDPDDPTEAEGVLNPAAARGPDGTPYLFPRLVASGNRSRIGLAEIVLDHGVPTNVRRAGVVLEPDRGFEHGLQHGGVEDPRVTWMTDLGCYVMAYVAYGPLGPRPAVAVSTNAVAWQRLGPIQFSYDDSLATDLNLFPNKDVAWFPALVDDPNGRSSYALIHRPMFDLGLQEPADQATILPLGITDARDSIWISYVDATAVAKNLQALCWPGGHRLLAGPESDWEALKIGGGTPPIRVPEGWLMIYHGVSGSINDNPFLPQKEVCYSAGGMILDPRRPDRVLARTSAPLLQPEIESERVGTVGNVVFPTATLDVHGTVYVLYGMADSAIGVARLDRVSDP